MTSEPQHPRQSKGAQSEKARRKAREAEALRANLRRRKDQARGRDGEAADKPPASDKP
jgi:hypothetical protein